MPTPSPLLLTPAMRADIDRNTTLCLACSSSLPPPKKFNTNASTSTPPTDLSTGVFTTSCCKRLICPTCIATNPRLLRYDPCIACFGGVGVVRSSPSGSTSRSETRLNVDGAVRDEDTFVLGDGEDDSDFDDEKEGDLTVTTDASPATQDAPSRIASKGHLQIDSPSAPTALENLSLEVEEHTLPQSPLKYHITRSDTLQGIVLRYGLDGHELCRLNNLPPSTLRTTPHLLHTRRFLILPPSAQKAGIPIKNETSEQASKREASRGKERAEKRLQTLTKEVDWRVAKAYVALADDLEEEAEEREEWVRKRKESGGVLTTGSSNLEERAIRRYLDDDEWEERQQREGVDAGAAAYRIGQNKNNYGHDRRWWQW